MKRSSVLTSLLLCGLAPAVSLAAETYLTEEDLLAEIPLVITASRLSQTPARAPASVTVIDREMIEASTALDIPDLLRLAPGFQVTYPNGNITSVTYHGNEDAWSNRMQVLVDGRSVYSPLFSIVDWTHLDVDIDDIERIEVIRGPNAPVYGSNAFLSTINIITRQPFQDRGLTARAAKGSLDTRAAMLRYAGSHGDLDYRVTASYRGDDGFEGVNDEKSLSSVSVRAVYDVTPNDDVDVQAGLTRGPEGAWGQSPVTSPERDKDTRSFFVYSRWRHTLSATSDIHVQAYTNYLDWSDTYRIGPLSALFGVDPALIPLLFGQPDQILSLSRYDGTVRREDIEIQHTLAPGADWRLVWGASYRRDTLESLQILGTPEPRGDSIRRLFANVEWTARDSLTVNAGAMLEDNGIIGTHASPRLAANYEWFSNQTVRAVATRASRSPSIYENYEFNAVRFGDGTVLDIQFISDQSIRAETINSYEIGYRALFPEADLELDLKIFREHMDDIITHPRDLTYSDPISPFLPAGQETGSFVRVNDGYVDTSGAEIQLMYRPARHSLLSFQYAYADADGRIIRLIEGDRPVRYNERIDAATPAHTVSVLSSHTFDNGFQASLAFFFLDATDWGGDGDDLPSYRRWDAKLLKKFLLGGLESSIGVLVQNLLDEGYAEFQKENIFERRTYLQLGVRM